MLVIYIGTRRNERYFFSLYQNCNIVNFSFGNDAIENDRFSNEKKIWPEPLSIHFRNTKDLVRVVNNWCYGSEIIVLLFRLLFPFDLPTLLFQNHYYICTASSSINNNIQCLNDS